MLNINPKVIVQSVVALAVAPVVTAVLDQCGGGQKLLHAAGVAALAGVGTFLAGYLKPQGNWDPTKLHPKVMFGAIAATIITPTANALLAQCGGDAALQGVIGTAALTGFSALMAGYVKSQGSWQAAK